MRPTCLLATLTLSSHLLLAQGWEPDRNAQRLAWGTANVVVRSDTVAGVQVWASTSRVMMDTLERDYAARFVPDSVIGWLGYAQMLIKADRAPVDSNARLRTPALVAIDGSQIVLERGQRKHHWDSKVLVILAPASGRSPWGILAAKGETEDFLQVLFGRTAASTYQPDLRPAIYEPNPAEPARCPFPLDTPHLRFPNNRLNAGKAGEVWLTFVIRPDSTVDPNSFQIVVSDGVEFTAEAVRGISSVRFRPATWDAKPVDARVFQRVSFLIGK